MTIVGYTCGHILLSVLLGSLFTVCVQQPITNLIALAWPIPEGKDGNMEIITNYINNNHSNSNNNGNNNHYNNSNNKKNDDNTINKNNSNNNTI